MAKATSGATAMANMSWRATAWELEHPDLDKVVLRNTQIRRGQGTVYRLDLERWGGSSAGLSFEARSEQAAKDRAQREAEEFVEVIGLRKRRTTLEKGSKP